MSSAPGVIVLGAGVAGCAAAYFLAREGVRVRVIEREAIGCGASGYAYGRVSPLTDEEASGPGQPFSEAAFTVHRDLWPVLQEESGVDLQARLVPHLEVCTEAGEVRARKEDMARWSRIEGLRVGWLEADDLRHAEPRLTAEAKGAVLVEGVGMLDSYRLTLALAQAAEHFGAEVVHGEATGLKRRGHRVVGVTTSGGEQPCGAVVIALGPWSGLVSGWPGMPTIRVEPFKGQMLCLEGLDPPLRYDAHGSCSLVQKADGLVWVASTEEHVGFDARTTPDARRLLAHLAVQMMPCLEGARVVRQTACLRPLAADSQPIVGAVPGWEGVYVATGGGKKGILLGPAMGRAVADLYVRGETPLPIAPFRANRFRP